LAAHLAPASSAYHQAISLSHCSTAAVYNKHEKNLGSFIQIAKGSEQRHVSCVGKAAFEPGTLIYHAVRCDDRSPLAGGTRRDTPHAPCLTRAAPQSAEDRLRQAFPGRAYAAVFSAMRRLAARVGPATLAADPHRAYALYERFRPAVASGAAGWGAAGDLRLADMARLAAEAPPPPETPPPHSAPALPQTLDRPGEASAQAAELAGAAAERVLAAVGRAGAGGLSVSDLAGAGGPGAAEAAEELQVEGALYARDGRLFLL
jgi:hypothetical protein